ncbi:MAG: OmpA family protein [Rickettsiales bacterium]|nr:OmpA family protein [Rickettsiales bacterium]
MAENTQAPIIIKKIKKGGHAHHGGAWKVAYADFVTAMMAFFLLLWLLNVTTPEQKLGLADYFTPTIGIKDSKGIGFKGGRSANRKGTSLNNLMAPGLVVGQVQQGPVAKEPTDAKEADPDAESTSAGGKKKEGGGEGKDTENADDEQFKVAEQDVKQALSEDPDVKHFKNNVQVEQSAEGMKINLIDDPKKEMFVAGGAALTPDGKKVLDSMASIITKTPNQVVIVGHTDASGPTNNPSYTNWELSTDRANAARRALVSTQVEPERIAKVLGMADRELLMPNDPSNARNRRITIILVRGSYFRDPRSNKQLNRSVLSVPDAVLKKPEEPKPVQVQEEAKPKGPSIFDPNATP